jgi:hypothetical protein
MTSFALFNYPYSLPITSGTEASGANPTQETQTAYPIQGSAVAVLPAPFQIQRTTNGQTALPQPLKNILSTYGGVGFATGSVGSGADSGNMYYQDQLEEATEDDWLYYQNPVR